MRIAIFSTILFCQESRNTRFLGTQAHLHSYLMVVSSYQWCTPPGTTSALEVHNPLHTTAKNSNFTEFTGSNNTTLNILTPYLQNRTAEIGLGLIRTPLPAVKSYCPPSRCNRWETLVFLDSWQMQTLEKGLRVRFHYHLALPVWCRPQFAPGHRYNGHWCNRVQGYNRCATLVSHGWGDSFEGLQGS